MSTPPEPPDETPEQTLARLQAGQSAQTPQSAGGAAPDPSAGLRFPQVRLREGYDIEAVDAFIRDIRSRTSEEIRRVQFPTGDCARATR